MIRKTVIITGAVGGIGSATAKKFAKNGYNIALIYNKTSPKKLEKELKEYGIEEDTFMNYIPKMAEDAVLSGSPGNTRKTVTKEDCMDIYKKIYFS